MAENNMKLIDYIKLHKSRFIHSLQCRAFSTPNPKNRTNHLLLIELIKSKQWEQIPSLIYSRNYVAAFEGVLACLNIIDYDDYFSVDTHDKIIKMNDFEYKLHNRQ